MRAVGHVGRVCTWLVFVACASRRAAVTTGVSMSSSPTVNVSSVQPSGVDAGSWVDAAAEVRPDAVAVEPIAGDLPVLSLDAIRAIRPLECMRGTCTVDGVPAHVRAVVGVAGMESSVPLARGWVHVIHPGAGVLITRRAGMDLLGVVLVGRAVLRLAEGGWMQHAEPWTAFLFRQGGVWVRAANDTPVALVLVTATHASPSEQGQRGTSRARYVVRSLTETPDLAWAGGAFHARIAFDGSDSPFASLGLLMASPRAPVPEHHHPTSWELLVALSASGTLRIPDQPVPGTDGGASLPARDLRVESGSVAYVPIGVRHAWQPDGTVPLIAVQSYAPPGPEQRFRALAAEAAR